MNGDVQNASPAKTNVYIFGGIAIIVILTISILFLFQRTPQPDQNPPVTARPVSFEECAEEKGSSVLETYPAVCVTKDGEQFTQTIEPALSKADTPLLQESLCNQNQGTWQSEYTECENISKGTCEQAGGTYLECESACRHNEDFNEETTMCIQICVPVCKF